MTDSSIETMIETTRRSYDTMASEYQEFVLDSANLEPFGQALIGVFADLVRAAGGPVLDAGCGPGHQTDLLDRLGVAARGVDISPAMIELARAHRPDLAFEVGSLLELDIADGALGGVLAHFSLIHLPPEHMPRAIAEFDRVLAPGGHLMLGFQTRDDEMQEWEAFDHKVSLAHRWPIEALSTLTRSAGFVELARTFVRPRPGGRFPAGYLVFRKGED